MNRKRIGLRGAAGSRNPHFQALPSCRKHMIIAEMCLKTYDYSRGILEFTMLRGSLNMKWPMVFELRLAMRNMSKHTIMTETSFNLYWFEPAWLRNCKVHLQNVCHLENDEIYDYSWDIRQFPILWGSLKMKRPVFFEVLVPAPRMLNHVIIAERALNLYCQRTVRDCDAKPSVAA